MELDQWLMIYLAISQTAAAKERSAWGLFVGGLIAQAILALAVVFLASVESAPPRGILFHFEIGLIGIGVVSSIAWLTARSRVQAEAAHLTTLMRGIEQNFAGGEFLRSLLRFSNGERVCSPASQWTCNEWLPSVSRLPVFARLGPRILAGWVGILVLFGWIALLVRAVAL
jgi:hypothetical protein